MNFPKRYNMLISAIVYPENGQPFFVTDSLSATSHEELRYLFQAWHDSNMIANYADIKQVMYSTVENGPTLVPALTTEWTAIPRKRQVQQTDANVTRSKLFSVF